MNSAEAKTAQKIGRIMRAVRKQEGLNQSTMASRLDISQGALSKYESATNIPSAHVWMEFCSSLKVPSHSYEDGYIDHQHPISVQDVKSVGSYKLPERYSHQCGSTARTVSPFLYLFKEKFGEEKLNEYFDYVDFDRDFFVNLSNPLNVNFSLDMARVMIEKGVLKQETVSPLVQAIPAKAFHGGAHQRYTSIQDSAMLLETFVGNATLYDCNTTYVLDDFKSKQAMVSITPSHHLKEFDYKIDSMGDFICQFKKNWFSRFLGYVGLQPTIEEHECHFKGAERCLYQIHLH